ncbi:MAG: chemotaxis protein CheW [Anaerolineae bacterium]|nr:chemotaxis protein CheW [Anaerolineae bacterium]
MSLQEHFSENELEILRARAERAARTPHRDGDEKIVTALQITLGGEVYALPVELLRAVYEKVMVVPIPCTPQHVTGIANIRGRIMPVLDLAILLNAPRPTSDENCALVVVSKGEISLAFQVEGIGEITTFPASSVGPLPAGSETSERTSYLKGMLANGLTLLNVIGILDDPTLVVDDGVA